MRRLPLVIFVAAVVGVGVMPASGFGRGPSPPPGPPSTSSPPVASPADPPSDFNGDGVDDLAVGVPREDVGGVKNQGAVNVLYSGSTGLASEGNQLVYQDARGVPDTGEPGDLLGFALAAGDFDGDLRGDLAIGLPYEDVGDARSAGAVLVMYGSSGGLVRRGSQWWTQGAGGILDSPETGDQFGYALAAGDLDGDGRADLAIGSQREDLAGLANVGAVAVMYGSDTGLSAVGNQLWVQGAGGAPGVAEARDQFGAALAVGDFDGDGRADLAAGARSEDVGLAVDAGAITVLSGSETGLTGSGTQWSQDDVNVADTAESGDEFGFTLATGDIGGDGADDLAVGVPGEDVGPIADAGAVAVLYGSPGGLSAAGNQVWHQEVSDVPGVAGNGDRLGKAMAIGDFDADGNDDLAAGARYHDVSGVRDAGVVNVLYGTADGLSTARAQLWTQDMAGNPVEELDHFGSVLDAADLGAGPAEDLVIGAHFESWDTRRYAGAFHVLYGSSLAGLGSAARQVWTQDSPGVLEVLDAYDYFPFALAAG